MSMSFVLSWKSLPAVTAPPVTVLLPLNVPAVDADHSEQCEYVSAVDTPSHNTAAVFEIAPPDAADPNVAWTRVVFAAAFAVPAAPGSPTWSFTHSAALPP